MAHPYTTTIAGLIAALRQLRSAFPAVVTAETLKKWSIASNNESQVLVVLRFLGILDDEGKKVAANAKAFNEHEDESFAKAFEPIVKAAYTDLFDTWGDAAWDLEKNKLIGFFRNADGSSARVGQQQASTFLTLAALAGHGPVPSTIVSPTPKIAKQPKKAAAAKPKTETKNAVVPGTPSPSTHVVAGVGPNITLRVEINLPVTDDQSVYDSIFKSIKANLLNA
jgi:hypothetical protein